MAREEITEYKSAEETVTKIQCGNCEETWNNRGIRGKNGVNTVVLDISVMSNRYSGWKERRFDSSIGSDKPQKMTGKAVEDYCNSCWDSFFTDGPAAEIEEADYYVEEETRVEYMCDFCGDSMGEDVDHEVTLNPRLYRVERHGVIGRNRSREEEVLTYDLDDKVSFYGTSGTIKAERDDCFDCCTDCATDIFDLQTRSSEGSLHGVMSSIADIFTF